jgi:hypothetical protein
MVRSNYSIELTDLNHVNHGRHEDRNATLGKRDEVLLPHGLLSQGRGECKGQGQNSSMACMRNEG